MRDEPAMLPALYLSLVPTFRTLSHDFDTVWCGSGPLLAHNYTYGAHIIAVIERPQRDCVLARTADQNVE